MKELSSSPDDLRLLRRFYAGLYVAGFPDADERESLANMEGYLELKADGWFGRNSYHVLLMLDGQDIVAASVSDYLFGPNCGIIEFLVVDETIRGQGLGGKMHAAVLESLTADAGLAGFDNLEAIVIELNDPFQVAPARDNHDPFQRALTWSKWGYQRLCFPYVQPALSAEQDPVTTLLLAIRSVSPVLRESVPAAFVEQTVRNYLIWCMRIEEPEHDPTFMGMQRYLAEHPAIRCEPLAVYVGRDPSKPLVVHAIDDGQTPYLTQVLDVYRRAFPPGPTVVAPETLTALIASPRAQPGFHHHLWGFADADAAPFAGMALFAVMRRFGFGGYLALEPPLRGTGRAGAMLKRIEEQMIRDEPDVSGWYIECPPGSTEEAIFHRLGFRATPLRYLQPALTTTDSDRAVTGPELTLMYKPLAPRYAEVRFSAEQLLADMELFLAQVYQQADPVNSPTYLAARESLSRQADRR